LVLVFEPTAPSNFSSSSSSSGGGSSSKGTFKLIDVAICGDRIVVKKEAEKVLKYKDVIK
jgi:hypothetical protein